MSQDIQLSTSTGGGADYWTQGQAAVGAAPPRQSPLKKAHRLLRGRYPLALLLAAIGAVGGAVGGYVAMPTKFQSDGAIIINPVVTTSTLNDTYIPMMASYIGSQSAIIESQSVAEEALTDQRFKDAWSTNYPGVPLMSVNDFVSSVDAVKTKTGTVITVSFTDRNKEVAKAGAQAVITAYMKLYGDKAKSDRGEKLSFNNDKLEKLNQDIALKKENLQKLSKYGTTDLNIMMSAAQTQLDQLQNEYDRDSIAYDTAMKAQAKLPAPPKNDNEFVLQQIAAIDPMMRDKLAARDTAIETFENLHIEGVLSASARYQRAQLLVQQRISDVEKYKQDFLLQHPDRINTDGPTILKNKLDNQAVLVQQQQKRVTDLGETQTKIAAIRTEMDRQQADANRVTATMQALSDEQELTKSLEVLPPGEAQSTGDAKRKAIAGAGFIFGGIIPVGLLMLYGMVDLRFRYSDDASAADLAGVALLGILPNLPDRLSDPQQAGIAAHCVHQIRTMLQINRTNDEPQVVAITSAAPGDGKTSLTLALGLSYAACGARTLLIDCDLVAAGLSHRLNVNAPEGVLEAVANRALLEFVRTTDIADVAILPVGTTHAHHASTLSPVALRRLLNESKKHFDIILVDTGPILGSIEASLVCAAADRTILTVARGQQRPLVERSIGHLQAIGARLAGVVFNRAQARDFERSLSGIAMRSRSHNTNVLPETPPSPTKGTSGSFKRAG
jgi:succinoglycan biosynthesis transport protein ExoP